MELVVKNRPANAGDARDTVSVPGSESLPLEKKMATCSVFLSGKFHGWRSLVAAVHGVTKSQARLSDFTFTFHFHALKKEMATHSSVLAWRILGTGEPGGLPSMGSHRVRHDRSNLAAAAVCPDSDTHQTLSCCLKLEI